MVFIRLDLLARILPPPIPVSGGSSSLSGFLNESDKLIGYVLQAVAGAMFSTLPSANTGEHKMAGRVSS